MKNSVKVTTSGDREIVVTRVFDAPREQVFAVMTKPELIKRWLSGPPGWEMTDCENDPQVGGRFRHVWRGPNGIEMAMHGVYREVAAPERLVRTEAFEVGCAPQAGEQLGTLVLTEADGKTTLTLTVLYPTKEARDGTLASGMEQGITAGYNRVDDLLASSAAG